MIKNGEQQQRELERRIFHLKTLYDAGREIGYLKDTDEIIKNLLMMVMGTFGVLKGIVLLVDMNTDKIEAIAQRGMENNFLNKLTHSIKKGNFQEIKDVTDVQILDKNDKGKKIFNVLSSFKLNLLVPFTINQNLVGGIGLGERLTGDSYTSDDRELLTTLSSQGAMALKNAQLVEQLERRIFHLKTLYDASQEIGFLKGTGEVMKSLLMMVMGTFGILSGITFLVDITNKKIKAFSQRGVDSTLSGKLSEAVLSGHFSDLVDLTHVTGVDDRDHNKGRIFQILSDHGLHLWIPLQVNENLKGGIGLGNRLSADSFAPDDRNLLSTLSNQGAVAVENIQLIEQMKKEEIVRTNLSRYLSPQIVEDVIHNDVNVNLGGDRKTVTVLFSDIRDFTTITETRPADQLVHILNEYFTDMAKIIFENQGSLDKYIGDALVAVFGSLVHVENPAQNAVEASIQMMKTLPELNKHWTEEFDFSMDIGIGITTGEVFLGNIGSPERMEFTVIGDTVNVASRFSGLAKAGQILVTRETFSQLRKETRFVEHPPTEVKGKTGKLEVFEIQYF
jgi:class 3 adenylate cyclase